MDASAVLHTLILALTGAVFLGAYVFALGARAVPRPLHLTAPLVVSALAIAAMGSAHAGINESWTGAYALEGWRWLGLIAPLVGALIVASLALYRLGMGSGLWLVALGAALAALGIVQVYTWEIRDANAYISTVALPGMRAEQRRVAEALSLPDDVRQAFSRRLGDVPSEVVFEENGRGRATALNDAWLDTYNDAARRMRSAQAMLPPQAATRYGPHRDVATHQKTLRQLIATTAGLLIVPAVASAALRVRAWRGARLRSWLPASGAAPLAVVAFSAAAGGGDHLPAQLPLGVQDVSAYELIELGLIIAIALLLCATPCETRPYPRRFLGLVGCAASVTLLAFLDLGAGVVLAIIGGIMAASLAGRRAYRGALIAFVAAALVLPIGAKVVGAPIPESVRDRLDMWSAPGEQYEAATLRNAAVAALERIASAEDPERASLLAGSGPVPAADSPGPSFGTAVSHLIQELRFRAGLRDPTSGEPVPPFIPDADAASQMILSEADALWVQVTGADGEVTSGDSMRVDRLVREVARAAESLAPEAEPTADASDATRAWPFAAIRQPDSFQLLRAGYAMRAGGLVGVGLGKGRPETIPAATEDVPLATIGESMGMVGAVLALAMAAMIAAIAFRNAGESRGVVSGLQAGLGTVFLVHAALSAAGTIGLLPFTGLTFPFLSRGGNAVIASFLYLGLLLGWSGNRRRSTVVHAAQTRPAWTLARGRAVSGVMLAVAPIVAGMALVQLTHRGAAPDALFAYDERSAYASTLDQWSQPNYRRIPGAVTDRDGQALSVTRELGGDRVFPDEQLAATLAHTLNRLDVVVSDETLAVVHEKASDELVGPTLVTTLDAGVQRALHESLLTGIREAGLPEEPAPRGAAIAIDVSTGEILAIASLPAFDLRELDDPSVWASAEAADRRAGFESRRLNRAIDGYYPPGSIFKTVTAAAALMMDGEWSFDYRQGDRGPRAPDGLDQLAVWHRLDLPGGEQISCGNHAAGEDWQLDLAEAFSWSCNVAFAEIGLALGAERLVDAAQRFGFERPIDVAGLGSSMSTLDREPDLPASERFLARTDGNLARTAFGQGQVIATPLQMALVAAAIANDGVIMQPRIVAGWRDSSSGAWLEQTEPGVLVDTGFNDAVLAGLRELMWASATYGWASSAKLNPFNSDPGVGGKTGSAEWSEEIDAPHAWFIGYVPSERPRIALAVVIERGVAGPTVAVRVANYFFGSAEAARYVEESSP